MRKAKKILILSMSSLLTVFYIFCAHYYIPEKNILRSSNNFNSKQANLYSFETKNEKPDNYIKRNKGIFSVLCWNIMEGNRANFLKNPLGYFDDSGRANWEKAFLRYADDKDIILLQEAYVDIEMMSTFNKLETLNSREYWWNIVAGFVYKEEDVPTGVMTLSNIMPYKSSPVLIEEPVLGTPKTTLLTKHRLNDDLDLLVINVHAILIGRDEFKKQLDLIKSRTREEKKDHKGPVILAGDFNTFTEVTTALLEDVVIELGLKPVFDDKNPDCIDSRVQSIMGHAYDHIYYSGLDVVSCGSIDLSEEDTGEVSDHNPMTVVFRILDRD